MVRAGLRLDMQNSSQERRRNSAPQGWRNSAPPPPKPRGGPSALAGGEEQSRSGSASVINTHALFARKVQRKLSNGVAGFAAGGSSSDRKRSRPIRAFSATPHDGQRPCRTLAEDPGRTQSRAAYPRRCSSNASGLRGQNSARILGIRASFQRDNLRRHF